MMLIKDVKIQYGCVMVSYEWVGDFHLWDFLAVIKFLGLEAYDHFASHTIGTLLLDIADVAKVEGLVGQVVIPPRPIWQLDDYEFIAHKIEDFE